jgi:hypothetical protein
MSWFSEYIGDPIKALIAKAAAGVDAELKILAGQAAAALPPAPISASAETAFETAIQTGMDAVIIDAVGEIPVAGALLAPEAVAAGNAAIDYAVAKGAAALNSLAASAKARLAAFAQAPAPAPAATTGVASGAVG